MRHAFLLIKIVFILVALASIGSTQAAVFDHQQLAVHVDDVLLGTTPQGSDDKKAINADLPFISFTFNSTFLAYPPVSIWCNSAATHPFARAPPRIFLI
jgi:hypothetical protein